MNCIISIASYRFAAFETDTINVQLLENVKQILSAPTNVPVIMDVNLLTLLDFPYYRLYQGFPTWSKRIN